MLAPGAEITGASDWHGLALESLRSYPEFVRELEEESGLSIDFRACGAVELAADDAELAELARRAESQEPLGIESSAVTPDGARQLVPALRVGGWAGGRYYPGDAIVDPRSVLRALVQVLQRRGVGIEAGVPVHRVQASRGGAVVDGRAARWAVLAAGAWAGGVQAEVDGERVRLQESIPVRGHLSGCRMAERILGPIVRRGHTYLLQRNSGYFIAGATEEHAGFERELDLAAAERLRVDARALLDGLPDNGSWDSWNGFRPGIASGAPAMGPVANSALWLAYGHYRNGVLMAPETARRIAAGIIASSGTG